MRSIIPHITRRIHLLEKEGKRKSEALYDELLFAERIEENDVWVLVDALGRTDAVIMAIICSKVLSDNSMYRLMRLMRFDFELCWLTFQYYRSTSLQMRILKERERRFLLKNQDKLLNTAQPLPADFLSTLAIRPTGYSHDMPSYSTM